MYTNNETQERWEVAFAKLNVLENISKGNKTDEQWLNDCLTALRVLNEIDQLVSTQRRSVLESIRYEYPRNNMWVDEDDITMMGDEQLREEVIEIFGQYNVMTV